MIYLNACLQFVEEDLDVGGFASLRIYETILPCKSNDFFWYVHFFLYFCALNDKKMKTKNVILLVIGVVLSAVVMTGCKHAKGGTKVSATGTIYECLVVMPSHKLANPQEVVSPSAYAENIATTYDLVKSVMAADMPCMPQMEPYFKLTLVSPAAFDDLLKPTRNILIIDIDPARYTQVKARFSTDYWSHPQAVYRIQAPDDEAFVAYWNEHGTKVRDWFVNQEMERQISFYKAGTNKDARAALQRSMHADMLIPEDYMLIRDTVWSDIHFIWCCNNKGPLRRDLVIYSYPYQSVKQFGLDALNAKRDEVLGQMISATVPGSYMGTEYKIFPPQMRVLQDNPYTVEVRGLWKILKGEAMGGPYVSHSCLDEINQRIITAETYILAPGQKKRNELRKAEAILYTLQLEQQMNELKEVSVEQPRK